MIESGDRIAPERYKVRRSPLLHAPWVKGLVRFGDIERALKGYIFCRFRFSHGLDQR